MDNEDLERKNQAFESAIENWEEKIDSLLEEIALTQSERDDTKAWLTEQIDTLNQRVEELEFDVEVKEKQIKKYKFLQILHDYGTTADEILDKAANPNRISGRGSTVLPNSARHKSSSDFNFNVKSNHHRNSDFMCGPTVPLISSLTSNLNLNADLASGSKQKERRNSTDFLNLSPSKHSNSLVFKQEGANDVEKSKERKNSVDFVTPNSNKIIEEPSPKEVEKVASKTEPKIPQAATNPLPDFDKLVSFGSKPSTSQAKASEAQKQPLLPAAFADADALLDYEGTCFSFWLFYTSIIFILWSNQLFHTYYEKIH